MRSAALFCSIALSFFPAHADPASPDRGRTVILNSVVVPMDSPRTIHDKAVILEGERISSIIGRRGYEARASDLVIDANGQYLIPGLADMHIHLRTDPDETFRLFLANGVTTVRNMDWLDGGFDHMKLREEIAAGSRLGPRYLVSGPVLGPGRLPDVASVGKLLDKHVEMRADYVKVHRDLDPDVYDALIEGSAERGLTVVGHAQRSRPLEQTLRLYSVAHAEEFLYTLGRPLLNDPAKRKDAARQIAESGVFVSPTLVIYDAILDYVVEDRFMELPSREAVRFMTRSEREEWLSPTENEYRKRGFDAGFIGRIRSGSKLLASLTLDMHRAGVPLILGSDAFGVVVPGLSVHDELEKLVEIGLTPYEALRTATVNVGAYLHEEKETGMVAPGFRADLVLVGGNPLEKITATRRVGGLFVRGRWISGEERDAMLAGILESRSAPD